MSDAMVREVIWGSPLQLTLWWDEELLDRIDLTWVRDGEGADAPAFTDKGRALEQALARYVRGEAVQWPELPFAWERVTAFRRRVLRELLRVPAGQTVSYGELAERVGSPKASRAVGGCMANNPWPLVVPCHRVLAAGGRLGGFGPGLEMKRWLLELEGALTRS
jgi:methylated-DNA-[protein]-cysteine S-methyltransferase